MAETIDQQILANLGESVSDDEQASTSTTTDDPEASATTDTSTSTDATRDKGTSQGTTSIKDDKLTGGPKDLVDAAGNVIARAGPERRFYETAQRLRTENETFRTENTTLRAQVEAYEKAGTVGKELSLSPDEVVMGAQLFSAWKTNPVETVKYLLTQAKSQGHNIDDLATGTDLTAIKKMLSEALAPINSERQARLDTQERQKRANEIYSDFVGQFPDAVIHQDSLAQILAKDKNLSLEAAYFKLKTFYLERSLDWSKPLSVLLQEETNKTSQQTGQANQQGSTLPQGDTTVSDVTDTGEAVSVETSLDDIIRASMKEAGMRTELI